MRRRAACLCSMTGAFCLYPGSAFHVSASHALVAAFMIAWQLLLSGQFQMQRSMQLDVALLELKPICDEAILCLSFACLFVPHGSHMHLRDQKAHMQMRLQEVFDKKQLGPNAVDARDDSIRCDAASFKEILPNISCTQIVMLVEKAYVGVTAGAGTRRRGSVDSGLPVGIRCAGGLRRNTRASRLP